MLNSDEWEIYRNLRKKFSGDEMTYLLFSLSVNVEFHAAERKLDRVLSKQQMLSLVDELETYYLSRVQNWKDIIKITTK